MDTTRASKNIQLILISSALAYGGWHVGQRLMADERPEDTQRHGHGYVHRPGFWYWGGGSWGWGGGGSHWGSSSSSSSRGLTGGSHGSSGSASSRGGFGGSGHGAAS